MRFLHKSSTGPRSLTLDWKTLMPDQCTDADREHLRLLRALVHGLGEVASPAGYLRSSISPRITWSSYAIMDTSCLTLYTGNPPKARSILSKVYMISLNSSFTLGLLRRMCCYCGQGEKGWELLSFCLLSRWCFPAMLLIKWNCLRICIMLLGAGCSIKGKNLLTAAWYVDFLPLLLSLQSWNFHM